MPAVQENFQYPFDLKKTSIKESVDEIWERVELRVVIARTLTQGYKIILADESTGNLDSTNARNIVEILRGLAHDDGCTVIIVTHDPAVAEQADMVLQMRDGSWI